MDDRTVYAQLDAQAASPPDLTRDERRLCTVLAYALMSCRKTDPIRFEALVMMIFGRVPQSKGWRGRELLTKLLVVQGGRA